jgi:hypothetical protein
LSQTQKIQSAESTVNRLFKPDKKAFRLEKSSRLANYSGLTTQMNEDGGENDEEDSTSSGRPDAAAKARKKKTTARARVADVQNTYNPNHNLQEEDLGDSDNAASDGNAADSEDEIEAPGQARITFGETDGDGTVVAGAESNTNGFDSESEDETEFEKQRNSEFLDDHFKLFAEAGEKGSDESEDDEEDPDKTFLKKPTKVEAAATAEADGIRAAKRSREEDVVAQTQAAKRAKGALPAAQRQEIDAAVQKYLGRKPMPIPELFKKLKRSCKVLLDPDEEKSKAAKQFLMGLLKRITVNIEMNDSSGKRVTHYKLKPTAGKK